MLLSTTLTGSLPRRNLKCTLIFNSGRGEFVMYASDLTEDYVAFNKGDVSDPATLGG